MSPTTTLYRFYDVNGALLYIGIAGNPGRRFEQHAHHKRWWHDVATTTLEHHPTRERALLAEAQAIRNEKPLHNVIHNTNTPRPVRQEVVFECRVCRQGIYGDSGYIQSERIRGEHAAWEALHRTCDPDITSNAYWWASERITTREGVLSMYRHLIEKVWMDDTDLDTFLMEHVCRTGPRLDLLSIRLRRHTA